MMRHGQAVDGLSVPATEKNFWKMMGYRDLRALEAILNGSKSATRQAVT